MKLTVSVAELLSVIAPTKVEDMKLTVSVAELLSGVIVTVLKKSVNAMV